MQQARLKAKNTVARFAGEIIDYLPGAVAQHLAGDQAQKKGLTAAVESGAAVAQDYELDGPGLSTRHQ